MKTLAEYCKKNILVIPHALTAMDEVTPLMSNGDLAIFYEYLIDDLVDVEFYTNTPCFVYIESGLEVITTADNKTHELGSNTIIFLPQGYNLHSDFVRSTASLKAYMVFLDDAIISEYLSSRKMLPKIKAEKNELFKVKSSALIRSFFKSIQAIHNEGCNSPDLLKVKLLEFLHLVALQDEAALNRSLSYKPKTMRLKRNIARLLKDNDILHLSVDDLSHLSGRSLSSFNRDFRAIYNMPPKRWLQEKRLNHAKMLLTNNDLSVTEVASELGYENISHFIKLFKEKYQITPKQFKQEF